MVINLLCVRIYDIARNDHEAQHFEGRAVNAQIKTGINSHTPVFHIIMQSYW